jgi:DNA-binding protein HU-beta
MNKVELISKAVEVVNAEEKIVTKKDATAVVDAFIGAIIDELVAGGDAKIAGLGKFSVVDKPAKDGICALTKEPYHSDAKKAPRFKASSTLKSTLND